MSIDTIGNFLTVIRNGLMVKRRTISLQHSNMREAIATVLKNEGFIRDFKKTEEDNKAVLTVVLKYVDGESAINEITRKSTPGRRQYERSNNMTSVIGGLGISILTTSKGVMTDKQATKQGIGGEVICHIW